MDLTPLEFDLYGRLLKEEPYFKDLRRKLFAAAALHRAEPLATMLVYGQYSRNLPVFREDLERLAEQVSEEDLWSFFDAITPGTLEELAQNHEYPYMTLAASRHIDDWREVMKRWPAPDELDPSFLRRCTEMALRTFVQDERQAYRFISYSTFRRNGIKEAARTLHLENRSVKALDDEKLEQCTLDEFNSTVFSTKEEFLEDFVDTYAARNGFFQKFGWNAYRGETGQNDTLVIIRYDEGDEPLLYCFLSPFLERLEWIPFTDDAHTQNQKRRIGGKIGYQRQSAKTLENLSI